MIFALFKDPILVLLIFCNKNRATQNKKEKQSGKHFFRHFLFSSANFFFDLRVNNRVVVIINYPHKVKTNKTHSLINRNKQRKNSFSICLHLISASGKRLRVSHRQTAKNRTHTQIYQRFIHQIWSCGAKIPHKHTKISIIRNLLLSYCKTFQTNQIHTHKPIKNLMVFNHTTSRSFIIITITLSLFVTVKCIGYI